MRILKPIWPGTRFGELTVLYETREKQGRDVLYFCICSCGEFAVKSKAVLRLSVHGSCGCWRAQQTSIRNRTHGFSSKRATGKPSRVYIIWNGMKLRCYSPKTNQYENYGGRGIAVCERWRNSFEAFLEDMGEPPSERHTLDRIDSSKNYEPDNCRWATGKAQGRNRRNNRYLEWQGQRLTVAEWSEKTGIRQDTITKRLDLHKWTIERALTTSPH